MPKTLAMTELVESVNRASWLAGRRLGIGGSDVAALFGENPWTSKYGLYADKMGLREDGESSAILDIGNELEPYTRRKYTESTGRIISKVQDRGQHPEYSWMLSNTDGEIAPLIGNEHNSPGVFEGKTTNPYGRTDWSNGAPLNYLLQTHHYMIVTGKKWASIAVIVLGKRDPLLWSDIEYDEELAGMIIEAERRFWHNHVLAHNPPDVDGHKDTTLALKQVHPSDSGLVVELDEIAAEWSRNSTRLTAEIKALKSEKDDYDNRLKAAIGGDSYGVFQDGTGVSWKSQDRKASMTKASTCRVLRTVSRKSMDDALRVAERTLAELASA